MNDNSVIKDIRGQFAHSRPGDKWILHHSYANSVGRNITATMSNITKANSAEIHTK
jgi:hypothetical protein